jgi:dihydroorotase
VHLCHMSTRGSVELIRRAKEKGLHVTAEAAPHHFALTHERVGDYDTNAKMNPPLREDADREAIRQGLADGTIDCIATDHAPHHYDAKEREFDDAPNGIIGLETALSIGLQQLVVPGLLSLPILIERMSTSPARLWHLPGGSLARGSVADVVVFDPDASWTVDPLRIRSRSRNSPWLGETLPGVVRWTVVGGRVVFGG